MTVIELGELGSAPPMPAGTRRGRGWRAAVRAAAAVEALLCVVAIAGSVHPAPTIVDSVWSVPITRTSLVTVAADTVFVRTAGAGSQVTAYDLDDGTVRWSTRIPVARGRMVVQEPGALMVAVGRTGAGDTMALDLRTGAQLWRLPGDVVYATAKTVLLAGQGTTARQARMADGATIWSRPVAGAVSWTVADYDRWSALVIAAAADGPIQEFRLADGLVLARGRLANDRGVPVNDGVDAIGGVFLVNRMETDRAAVTAYDLDTLHARWRFAQSATDMPPNGPAGRACGVVVCFLDGSETVALDPATGTVRWRAAGWLDPAPTIDESRLLAAGADGTWHALIDSATGRVAGALGEGSAVWDPYHLTPVYYLRAVAHSHHVAVSRIDLRTGLLHFRGMVAEVGPAGCTAAERKLVCGTTDGQLAVTAVG